MYFKLLIVKYFLELKFQKWLYRSSLPALRSKRWLSFQRALVAAPFYADLAGKGADLPAYPLMDKKAFMTNFDTINTVGINRLEAETLAVTAEESRDFSATLRGITIGLSSGTSGNRGIFLASEQERARWVAGVLDRVIGWSFKRRSVAFFLRANSKLYASAGSRLLRFGFFDLLQPVEDHVIRLNQFKPDILVAQPSLLLALAAAIEMGRLTISPRKVISVAEVLYPEDRMILERVFGQKIHEVYQCTEGFLAASCAYGTLHFNEDFIVVERKYLDASRKRYHPVITDLLRTSQPVVRYELNDIIHPRSTPCPCGSTALAIGSIEGRSDDILPFRDKDGKDRRLFPDFFRRAIIGADAEISDYELVRKEEGILELFVAGTDQTYQKAEAAIIALLRGQGITEVVVVRQPVKPRRPGEKQRRIRNEKY